MNVHARLTTLSGILIFIFCLISGCVQLDPEEDPVRYYVLSTDIPEDLENAEVGGTLVDFRLNSIPEYARRRPLAIHQGNGVVEYLPYERWAESLQNALRRVFEQHLEYANADWRVNSRAMYQREQSDLSIFIRITELQIRQSGQVVLSGEYTESDIDSGKIRRSYQKSVQTPWSLGEYHTIPSAIEAAVAEFLQNNPD